MKATYDGVVLLPSSLAIMLTFPPLYVKVKASILIDTDSNARVGCAQVNTNYSWEDSAVCSDYVRLKTGEKLYLKHRTSQGGMLLSS